MCLTPVYLSRKDVHKRVYGYPVPCGKCPECLKKRQNALVVRAYIESVRHPKVCFVTLTYNDDRVPCNDFGEMSLRREDLKNWKKDFRKKVSNHDFSWFLCGEYGPRTHRPHYHGLFFGLDYSDLRLIERSWSDKYGFTVFKNVPVGSLKDYLNVSRYVAKYVVKDSSFVVPSDFVERPRVMSSVRFGYPDDAFFNWMLCFDKFDYDPFDDSTISLKIVLSVIERLYFPINGFKYKVPDYAIRKKLYRSDLKGSLSPSPLWRMVSAIKRVRAKIVSDEEFNSLVSKNLEFGEFVEALDKINSRKEVANAQKYIAQREDIISTYKKSLI